MTGPFVAFARGPEEVRRALALLPCGTCGAAGPHHLFEEASAGATAACWRCGRDVRPSTTSHPGSDMPTPNRAQRARTAMDHVNHALNLLAGAANTLTVAEEGVHAVDAHRLAEDARALRDRLSHTVDDLEQQDAAA